MRVTGVGDGIGVVDLSAIAGIAGGTLAGSLCLMTAVLPRCLVELPDGFFKGCGRLTCVNMDDCRLLRRVGQECFQSCTRLQSIEFPKSLEMIGRSAFQDAGVGRVFLDHARVGDCCDLEYVWWLGEIRLPACCRTVTSVGWSVRLSKLSVAIMPLGCPQLREMRFLVMNASPGVGQGKWACAKAAVFGEKAAVFAEKAALWERVGRPFLPM
jgi:hypothetical protein